jgi:lipopolysaccharide biosynthesis glycosyltransferase
MTNNAIFISFDDNYLSYAKSCINSILSNYPSHPVILLNYSGNQKIVADEYLSSEKIKILQLQNDFNFTLGPIKNPIVYDRFLLWGEIFQGFDKILHLDVDTLVLRPLDDLFQDDFFITSDNHISARSLTIHDQRIQHQLTPTDIVACHKLLKEDGLQSMHNPHAMANAGVFLISKKYRGQHQLNSLIRLSGRYDKYLAYADQSAISIWCAQNNIKPSLDFKFNQQIRFLLDQKGSIDDTHILHFSGEAKFYDQLILNPNHTEIYRQCDLLRLFYRKTRNLTDLQRQLEPLKKLLKESNSRDATLNS